MPVPPLDRFQRWFQTIVMHPQGIVAGAASEEARTLAGDSTGSIEDFVTRSSRLTAVERLQVYGNAYFGRLLECLQDEFPAVRHAVGDDAFSAFVFGYLQSHPSHSYTLARLGESFPRYLHDTRPAADPESSESDSWTDFVVELARLERIYSEVFDGPGMEDAPRIDTHALLALPQDQWGDVRLIAAPCLRVVEFAYPVDDYAAAVRHKESPEVPPQESRRLAVYRSEFVVRRLPLTAPEHAVLSALASGQTLAESIESALAAGVAPDELQAGLRDWFALWTSLGFFDRAELAARH